MKTSAIITTVEDGAKLVNKGDVLELVTGEKGTFLEMKRTKFVMKIDGKKFLVPVYRKAGGTDPYVKRIVGFDDSVVADRVEPTKLKFGDLFSIEGSKETFMFVKNDVKRSGKKVVIAHDLASGRSFTIDGNMDFNMIDLKKVKEEYK